MTAAGNTTTRLLGTFQKVDYVFIVGVAGGIPHYTDYKKHVRLGDVVVSSVDPQPLILNGNGLKNGHGKLTKLTVEYTIIKNLIQQLSLTATFTPKKKTRKPTTR